MKINIVALKRLEINILTRHKLPDPPPPFSPPESNGRPLNGVVSLSYNIGVWVTYVTGRGTE